MIIENAEAALKKTISEIACSIKDYTVAPVFMDGKEKGAHEWMIEFDTQPDDVSAFAKALDQNLQRENSDYEAKRANNITLTELRIHNAKPDLFYNWLKQKNKLGGQHKIPRLSNSRDYMEELLQINKVMASKS